MGTPASTYVIDETEETYDKPATLVRIYRQADGYPSGQGVDLAKYLLTGEIVNGLHFDDRELVEWNGIDDFAAALVCHLKDGPGGIYIVPIESGWETSYSYVVALTKRGWRVDVYGGDLSDDDRIFSGTPEELLKTAKSKPRSVAARAEDWN